jgi:hypothetical protein
MALVSLEFRTLSLTGSMVFTTAFSFVPGTISVFAPTGPGTAWGDIADEILSYFQGTFPVAQPTIPIAWDNVPFVPPDTAYVAIRIEPGETKRASLGAVARWRTFGTVIVDILTPNGQDALQAFVLAGDITEIWRGKSLGFGLEFQRTETQRVGINEQKKYQLTVHAPFRFDVVL